MNKKNLTLDDIRNAIKETDFLSSDLGDDVEKMSDEAFAKCDFAKDLGMDSIDMVEVTMALERKHAINISDRAIECVVNNSTVQKMLDKYNECQE